MPKIGSDLLSETFSELRLEAAFSRMNPESIEMNNGEAGPSGLPNPAADEEVLQDAEDLKTCKNWSRFTGIPPLFVDDGFGNDARDEDRNNELINGLIPQGGVRIPYNKYEYCILPDGRKVYRLNPKWQVFVNRQRDDKDKAPVGKRQGRGAITAGMQFESRNPSRARIVAVQHPNPPVLFAGTDHEVAPLTMQGVPGPPSLPTYAGPFASMDDKIGALEQDPATKDEFKRLVNELAAQLQLANQQSLLAIPGMYAPGSNLKGFTDQARQQVAAAWTGHAQGRNAAATTPPAPDSPDWELWLRTNVHQQRPVDGSTVGPLDASNRRVQIQTLKGTHLLGKEFAKIMKWNIDPREVETVGETRRMKFSTIFNAKFDAYLDGKGSLDDVPSAHENFGIDPSKTFGAFARDVQNAKGEYTSLVERIKQLRDIPGFVELVDIRTDAIWYEHLRELRSLDTDELPDFPTDGQTIIEARVWAYGEKRREGRDGEPGAYVAERYKLAAFRRRQEEAIARQWDFSDPEGSLARIRAVGGGGGTVGDVRPTQNKPLPFITTEMRDAQRAKMVKGRNQAMPPPPDHEVDKAIYKAYNSDSVGYFFNDTPETLRDIAYRGTGGDRAQNWQRDGFAGLMRPVDFPLAQGQVAGEFPGWLGYTPWRRRIETPKDYADEMNMPSVLNWDGPGQVEVVWFATLQSEMYKFRHRNFLDPETGINEVNKLTRIAYAMEHGDETSIPPVLNIGSLILLRDAIIATGRTDQAQYVSGFDAYIAQYEAYLVKMDQYKQAQDTYAKPLAEWQKYREWDKEASREEINHGLAYQEYEDWYSSLPTMRLPSGEDVRYWLSGMARGAIPVFVADKRKILQMQSHPSEWPDLGGNRRRPPAPESLPEYSMSGDLALKQPPLPTHNGNATWDASNPGAPIRANMPSLPMQPDDPPPVVIPMPLKSDGKNAGMPLQSYQFDRVNQWPPVRAELVYELYKLGAFELLNFKRSRAPTASRNDPLGSFFKQDTEDKTAFVLFYALYPAKEVFNARMKDPIEQRKMMDKFETEFMSAARVEARKKAAEGALDNAIQAALDARDDALEAEAEGRRDAIQAERIQRERDGRWAVRDAGRKASAANANADKLVEEIDPSVTQPAANLWTPYANGDTNEPPPHPQGDGMPNNPSNYKDGQRYEQEAAWLKRLADWERFAAKDHRRLPWKPRRHEASYHRYAPGGHVEKFRRLDNTLDLSLQDDPTDRAPVGSRRTETPEEYEERKKRYDDSLKEADAQRAANADPNDVLAQETAGERLLRETLEANERRKAERKAKKQAEKEAKAAAAARRDGADRDGPPQLDRERSRNQGGIDARMDATRLEAEQPMGQVDFGALRAFANLSIHEVGVALIGMSGEDRAAVLEQIRGMGPEMEKAARILMAREVVRRVDK